MTRGGAEDGGGGGRGSGGRAGNEDDNPLVELAEMRRVIERQSKQMQEMQRLIMANATAGGGGSGNRGGGWGEYGVAQHANFGPGNGSSAEPFGSSSRVWPGRGSKRDHETSYEYAKLVAEASEDERSRRVRIETLRALQGGSSQLPWP